MGMYQVLCILSALGIIIAFLNQYVMRMQTTIAITSGALAISVIMLVLEPSVVVVLSLSPAVSLPLLSVAVAVPAVVSVAVPTVVWLAEVRPAEVRQSQRSGQNHRG